MVARRAHNPKVVGSNPAPATKFKKPSLMRRFFFVLLQVLALGTAACDALSADYCGATAQRRLNNRKPLRT